MADDIGGVWRTVGGRRIFIKDGQDLASAMKESGKFTSNKFKDASKYKEIEEELSRITTEIWEATMQNQSKEKISKLQEKETKIREQYDKITKKIKEQEKRQNEQFTENGKYKYLSENLEKQLSKQSDELYQKISKNEQNALYSYSLEKKEAQYSKYSSYEKINKSLRMGNSEDIKENITQLDNAIARNKINENIITYRGLSEEALQDIQIGSVITDKAFVSTTLDKNVALKDFSEGALLEIKLKEGTNAIYMNKNFTKREEEKEILLSRNKSMLVIGEKEIEYNDKLDDRKKCKVYQVEVLE